MSYPLTILLVYSVSVDPDIDNKQVIYMYLGHKAFLEKLTNHLLIKIFYQTITEHYGIFDKNPDNQAIQMVRYNLDII